MNQRPEPRIGDAERTAAAEALGEHYAAGRLTKEEYDERSGSVWAAKTASDLRPLFLDLPPLGQPGRRRSTAPEPRPYVAQGGPWHRPRSGFRFPWFPVLLVVIGLALLLDGAWWLILLGGFFLARSFGHARGPRHGCGGAGHYNSGSDRAPRGSWS